jgi:hypothetical protein
MAKTKKPRKDTPAPRSLDDLHLALHTALTRSLTATAAAATTAKVKAHDGSATATLWVDIPTDVKSVQLANDTVVNLLGPALSGFVPVHYQQYFGRMYEEDLVAS